MNKQGFIQRFLPRPTPKSDYDAIKSDWDQVGKDFRTVINWDSGQNTKT